MIDDPEYPHVQYLVPKDSPIQSLDEAIGHKVAVSSVSPCTDGYVRYYLKSKGLNPDDAEYVIINQDLQEQSASQGLVDTPPLIHPMVVKRWLPVISES